MFGVAVTNELRKFTGRLDLVYAHFFYPAGLAARWVARRQQLPYFVAHGDDAIDPWHRMKGKAHFADVTGVVAVSTDNAQFCKAVFDIPESRVGVFPNGVDRTLFFPHDRDTARRRLGLPLGLPLVAFVGHFISRKGPDRVLAALEGIPSVKALMIGEGPVRLASERIQFQGVVQHSDLPLYLSAADVFVLPTTAEGSCNAILEAMACGLPVVTSEGSFNDDILNPGVAVRVDPMNVVGIRQATAGLLGNLDLRRAMSRECVGWSAGFSIEKRAIRIADWIEGRLQAPAAGDKA
jgi:glycosyltransferase involved in cell wall biosynthesis